MLQSEAFQVKDFYCLQVNQQQVHGGRDEKTGRGTSQKHTAQRDMVRGGLLNTSTDLKWLLILEYKPREKIKGQETTKSLRLFSHKC